MHPRALFVTLFLAAVAAPLTAQARTAPELLPATFAPVADAPSDPALFDSARTPSAAELRSAMRLSALSTVLPIAAGVAIGEEGLALAAFGLLMGPSMGYFQVGRVGRGVGGMGIRLLAGIGGLAAAFAICGMDCASSSDDASTSRKVFGAGLALAGISAIHDIDGLHSAAARAAAAEATVALTPER